MREAILVFGGDGEAAVRLRRALLPLKVMVRPIPLADYGHSLGRLAGDGSCPAAEGPFEGEELPQTLLVLAGFTDRRLDQALAAMARAGLRFPYKAVLTASNRLWRAPDLYREVVREHEAMTARRPIAGEQ